jgi:hypothetical protein
MSRAYASKVTAGKNRISGAMTWTEMLGYYDEVHESETGLLPGAI